MRQSVVSVGATRKVAKKHLLTGAKCCDVQSSQPYHLGYQVIGQTNSREWKCEEFSDSLNEAIMCRYYSCCMGSEWHA